MKKGEIRCLIIAVVIAIIAGPFTKFEAVEAMTDSTDSFYKMNQQNSELDQMSIQEKLMFQEFNKRNSLSEKLMAYEQNITIKNEQQMEAKRLEEEKQKEEESASFIAIEEQQANPSSGISITLYGVDCYGCKGQYTGRGNTGTGIQLDVNQGVLQSNGQWQAGITYDGYYIIAAGSQYPVCSVVEISNHSLSGRGLTPGVPFYAVVADRGGAIYGDKIDLYAGSEKSLQVYNPGSGGSIRIISQGNPNGRGCSF